VGTTGANFSVGTKIVVKTCFDELINFWQKFGQFKVRRDFFIGLQARYIQQNVIKQTSPKTKFYLRSALYHILLTCCLGTN
jgi:hypothetical protein